ncbi:MAG: response regulator [Candidatus Hydrogenedentota bacterium]
MPKHVLVVDDEELMCSLLSSGLSNAGFLVTTAKDATEALALLADGAAAPAPVDLLLTDFNMPRLTGLDLVDAVRRSGVELPCFLMSGDTDESLAAKALSRGCAGFIGKPFKLPALVGHMRQALEPSTAPQEQAPMALEAQGH